MKQLKNLFYLVVLGAAIAMSGCGGSTAANPSPTPTPTPSNVSIIATGPALAENGVKAGVYAGMVTVTNPNGTGTSYSCASSSANLATIDNAATCAFTPSATNAGSVTITATASADTTKTASFTVRVGNYVLMENSAYGLQMANIGTSAPVTLLQNNALLVFVAWFPDHNKIAGIDFDSNNTVINIYNTDGTAAGTMFDHKIDLNVLLPGRSVSFLGVSPDGTKVAFVTEEGAGVEGIYTVSSTTSAAPTLLRTEPANGMLGVSGIWFTPDGSKLLVENIATQTIWAMKATDGSNFQQVVALPSVIAMYSPDMSTLYYANYAGGVWSTYVSTAATGAVTKTLTGYYIIGVAPNGANILLSDGTSVYTADDLGLNLSASPIGLGGRGSW